MEATMTLKEFAQHFGASNWRKAFVVAIEQLVPDGKAIIAEQQAAFLAHRSGRQRRLSREEMQTLSRRLAAANAAKSDAEQVIIERFNLFVTEPKP